MSIYRKATIGTVVFDETFKAGFYANGDLYVQYTYYDKEGHLCYFFERYQIAETISKAMMNAKNQSELKGWIEGLGKDIMHAEDVTKKNLDNIVEKWKLGIDYEIGARAMNKLFSRLAG